MSKSSTPSLLITEIYKSIQGESTFSGLPCIFIRLTGCDLRCSYCDSTYAFTGGQSIPLNEIIKKVKKLDTPLIEITGGEPLLQKNCLTLMTQLCDLRKIVLIETSGAHDISKIDPRVIRIIDLKCPSSHEAHRNLWDNLDHLRPHDEIKFVIGDRADFDWAKEQIKRFSLTEKTRSLLFSPVFKTEPTPGQTQGHPGIHPQQLTQWILEEKLPVRFQLQIHKYIWHPTQKGV